MKKRLGLLGETLAHSFSPLIHKYLGDYEYRLYETAPDELDAFMSKREFDGINVTIPYKQAVIPYCASLSEEARAIGSVNTIVKGEDGRLHGHNTDYHGFCAMLKRGGIDPNGKKALVLGDGGSAKTVRAALRGLNAKEIVTISRRGEHNYENISRHYDAEIIVNTTPVGMFPNNGGSPLPLAGFTGLSGVADLIYNPHKTNLLLEAERLNIPCIGGLTMLAAQAEAASRIFLNCPAREELAATICGELTKKTRNIALIGMPGCGKSTAGRRLAEMLNRPFADIDALVEAAAGMSIPELFASGGEEAFRKLETRVLGDEAKKSGLVIATGGGIVTREENLDLLRQNSLIVYLRRDLAELKTDGRPLSTGVGVAALAEKRLPLYEAWSDCAVAVSDDAEHTAREIMRAIG